MYKLYLSLAMCLSRFGQWCVSGLRWVLECLLSLRLQHPVVLMFHQKLPELQISRRHYFLSFLSAKYQEDPTFYQTGRPGHARSSSARISIKSCPYCSKLVATKSALDRHVRTHTGEKPYMCTLCPEKFAVSSNLYRHVRIKHNVDLIASNQETS